MNRKNIIKSTKQSKFCGFFFFCFYIKWRQKVTCIYNKYVHSYKFSRKIFHKEFHYSSILLEFPSVTSVLFHVFFFVSFQTSNVVYCMTHLDCVTSHNIFSLDAIVQYGESKKCMCEKCQETQ